MSVKRQRGDEAGADGEFLSQPDFQGLELNQNTVAMVGLDLLATDSTSLQAMDRVELEQLARCLLFQSRLSRRPS